VDGFLHIDKPEGPTSFDVVRTVKRKLRTGKVGHSGTLDPAASGLLILALGSATRLLPYVPSEPKRYLFEMQFGTATDTLDREGQVVSQGAPLPSREAIESAIPAFRGRIEQVPPRHSAVKLNGKKAYELARKDRDFELGARTVSVVSLQLRDYDTRTGRATLVLDCSTGTYVRALVRDLAEALGTVAYALSIRRQRIGQVSVDDACSLEDIEGRGPDLIITPSRAFKGCPAIVASEAQLHDLSFGRDIESDSVDPGAQTVFVFVPDGTLAAVATRVSARVFHPQKVLLSQ
jgi:tRNA pseudouridine55 synthase